MTEQRVTIESEGGLTLEGRFDADRGRAAAALCHPHPRYGGSMDNNVVEAARRAATGVGLSTLRFNFRGVGASSGRFDEGRGEQRDLEAAAAWLGERTTGPLVVLAYSFGAWVAARALSAGLRPAAAALISPPVDLLDHGGLELPALPTLVIAGDSDQYGSPGGLDRWLAGQIALGDHLERVTLEEVDHFYWSAEPALRGALADFLDSNLGG